MLFKLWDCLDYDSRVCLFQYQRNKHNKRWMIPEEPPKRTDKMSQNDPESETPQIMQALPEDVTHNRGVFKVD